MATLIVLFMASCLAPILLAAKASHLSGAEMVELDALRNENAILERRIMRASTVLRRELLLPNADEGLLRRILDVLNPGGI